MELAKTSELWMSVPAENAGRGYHRPWQSLRRRHFFYEPASADVKPIIGCEVYVARAAAMTAAKKPMGATARIAATPNPECVARIISCSSANRVEGYHNLIKLVSAGFSKASTTAPA